MLNKPLEYWAVLIGMVLYAATRDAEREALWKRAVKTVASAFLTYGVSPGLAAYFDISEIVCAIAVMAFGLLALDTGTALIADRAFIKELIRRKIGGSDGQS